MHVDRRSSSHRGRPELDDLGDSAQRAQGGRVQVVADRNDGPQQRARRAATAPAPNPGRALI